jgi:hypothetical protein
MRSIGNLILMLHSSRALAFVASRASIPRSGAVAVNRLAGLQTLQPLSRCYSTPSSGGPSGASSSSSSSYGSFPEDLLLRPKNSRDLSEGSSAGQRAGGGGGGGGRGGGRGGGGGYQPPTRNPRPPVVTRGNSAGAGARPPPQASQARLASSRAAAAAAAPTRSPRPTAGARTLQPTAEVPFREGLDYTAWRDILFSLSPALSLSYYRTPPPPPPPGGGFFC